MRQLAWGLIAMTLGGCGARGTPAPATTQDQWEVKDGREIGAGSRVTWFESGGAEIHVEIEGNEPAVGRKRVLWWVRSCADAVGKYYGKFPVHRVTIAIKSRGRGGIQGGKTFYGKRIDIQIGSSATERDLHDDWILTHEMFHLGFPDLGERYLWMNEGLSDYLEPVARARAGGLAAADVWKEWAEGFPQGLPEAGDQGLDNTHTWGRTYWGGTIFWLMADIRIREQTGGRRSLDDAIKAILADGGDGSQVWTLERVIDTANRATGTQVLNQLHDEMGTKPSSVDLASLWKRLGVRYSHGRVSFDDTAPLASIRRAITAPRH